MASARFELTALIAVLIDELVGLVESPIRGQKGNLEELAVLRKG